MLSTKFTAISLCLNAWLVDGMNMMGRPGHGFLGYGIEMYKPLCATACRDPIASTMLMCSEPMDDSDMASMDMGPETSPECYATDVAFLQTIAYCVSKHCEGTSVWEIEKWWNMNVPGRLPVQPVPKETYQRTLDKVSLSPPHRTFTEDDEELMEPSLVDEELWLATWNGDGHFEAGEQRNSRYGYGFLSADMMTLAANARKVLSYSCLAS